jgi:hypothetical protein
MSWETLLYITVGILVITLIIDIWKPQRYMEGFLVGVSDNPFLTAYFPRRGDISFGEDESGYIQDKRNVMGYADVQGLGVNHDFCRMIIPKGGTKEQQFFACALAGTENLSSTAYKTLTVGQGFKTSRDDYMRDADKDGKSDYCAVIKMPNGSWESQCYRALSTTFDTRTFVDTTPPDDIAEILYFYEGILFWFRFIDDMKDYGENLNTYAAGNLTINEADVKVLPSQLMIGTTTTLDDRIELTQGLRFDGSSQFLRLGDSPDMSFGKKISLITLRAMCFWVYFDSFTNNAHILDFGNGAGQDNIFVGIIGKGDESVFSGANTRAESCINTNESTIPDAPSGAQAVPSMSPQALMLSTSNLDAPCDEAPVLPRKLPPLTAPQSVPINTVTGKTATLLYEVWNGKLRLQHIKVQKAIPVKTWTHVCITTASGDGVRPAVQIWVNGIKMAEDPNGHLPQTSFTTNNYIGKSNWMNNSSKYENKPELFNGSLFDLRGYNQAVTEDKLKKTVEWGKKRLGLD